MKTLFLDMDGVVADFNKGAADIVGYALPDNTSYYPKEDWEKVRANQRIYRHLPKMPLADKLVSIARKFRDDLGWQLVFLTAVPHDNDIHWAFWDKCLWVQDYYPDIPVHFGPYSGDKWQHCQPGDILVDDRKPNCEDWTEHRGRAIHVIVGEEEKAVDELAEVLYLEQLKNGKL